MSESFVRNITAWCQYVAALASWAADCFYSIPKKEKFFDRGTRPADTKNPNG